MYQNTLFLLPTLRFSRRKTSITGRLTSVPAYVQVACLFRNFYAKFGKKTCHFGAFIIRFEPSRCPGWIGAVEKRAVEVSTQDLGDVWEPFFGHVHFWPVY